MMSWTVFRMVSVVVLVGWSVGMGASASGKAQSLAGLTKGHAALVFDAVRLTVSVWKRWRWVDLFGARRASGWASGWSRCQRAGCRGFRSKGVRWGW